jgi:hypothetical protein
VSDIRSQQDSRSWLVVGWFTPDYRHWAERLAYSLNRVGAPYYLLAKEPGSNWMANTRRKPIIASECLERFAGQTLVLMDVDVEALADLSPMVNTSADVCGFLKARVTRKGRTELQLSSRVLVLRGTPATARLIDQWRDECEQGSDIADEAVLGLVLARTEGLTFSPLPARYAARERDVAPPGAALVHDSARDLMMEAFNLRKLIKRHFFGKATLPHR